MKNKLILDACCGGRCFWFNKQHPNTTYVDKRKEEKGFAEDRPKFEINPDMIMDFTDLNFPDKSFKMVVFDPPHIVRIGNKSWMSQRYGMLGKDWKEMLSKGFRECWRVLDDYGTLIFKWSEAEIPVKKVLELFPIQPLFGHTTGRAGRTKWMCFMKIPDCESCGDQGCEECALDELENQEGGMVISVEDLEKPRDVRNIAKAFDDVNKIKKMKRKEENEN